MSRGLPRAIPVVPVLANLVRARARDLAPPAAVATVQARLLRRLVRHAHANVPYYRDRLDADAVASVSSAADLDALPMLNRADVVTAGTALLADGCTPANTRAAKTSGSSGRPVTLYYSERDLSYLRATYLWDMLACGLRPHDRIGFFRVGAFRRHRLERLGLARNVHVNTSRPVDEQVETFLARRPSFLYGFPSAMTAIVAELRRRGVRPTWVRTVLFAGEATTPDARAEILDYLGARGHEVYASVEAYTIARTCPLGAMHLRSADVVVEVLHEDGTVSRPDAADRELVGEILVTRLHAQAMPLLRYRLGDRVRIAPNDCRCGVRSTPILRGLAGRVGERVRTRDGRLRSSDFLFSLIQNVAGLRQIQMVHHGPGVVVALAVPAWDGSDGLADRLAAALAPAAVDFDIDVRVVPAIATESTGKVPGVRQTY
jgi:phenylacetate-CoA ligase